MGSAIQREWRQIPDFPNYEMTSDGSIRRVKSRVLMATVFDTTHTVKLTKDGVRYHRTIKALIKHTFPDLPWWLLK